MAGTTATTERAFHMLGNESLWQVAERLHQAMARHGVPYALAGGMAVCLHGYRRFTADLDVVIRREDSARFRSACEADGFAWDGDAKEFSSPSGIAVQALFAGDPQGPGQAATFPSPDDPAAVVVVEGLATLSLAALIQSKLARGLGILRRTHKDFADAVELIAVRRLDGSFARQLHPSLRAEFRKLVKHVR